MIKEIVASSALVVMLCGVAVADDLYASETLELLQSLESIIPPAECRTTGGCGAGERARITDCEYHQNKHGSSVTFCLDRGSHSVRMLCMDREGNTPDRPNCVCREDGPCD